MGIPSTTTANLEEQARLYRVITDIMLDNDNCPYMVIWGLKDNDSWRSASNPLLYDSGMGKKPAWRAVRSALRHHHIQNTIGISPALNDKGETTTDTSVYDLQGRKVSQSSSLKKGIYISQGRKIARTK